MDLSRSLIWNMDDVMEDGCSLERGQSCDRPNWRIRSAGRRLMGPVYQLNSDKPTGTFWHVNKYQTEIHARLLLIRYTRDGYATRFRCRIEGNLRRFVFFFSVVQWPRGHGRCSSRCSSS